MALARLRADPRWHPVALLTTVTRDFGRVSMHGVRRDVLHAQAAALGMPLLECTLDWPSSNAAYAAAMAASLDAARARWPGLRHCAFGDLFLADVRTWREAQLAQVGWAGGFPWWGITGSVPDSRITRRPSAIQPARASSASRRRA